VLRLNIKSLQTDAFAMWQLRAKLVQPPHRSIKFTHDRQLPLPLANTIVINGEEYEMIYIGHGHSKVVYKLSSKHSCQYNGCVMKVVCPPQADVEVQTMKVLHDICTDIVVPIHFTGFISSLAYEKLEAWICGYAQPLDQYFENDTADRPRCVLSALIAICRAAECKCLVTDVGFYNFGIRDDHVVIIDMGSRGVGENRISKQELTLRFFQKFKKMQ
jgi:hypothetical protein